MLYEEPKMEVRILEKRNVVRTSLIDWGQGGDTGGDDEDMGGW